MVHINYLSVFLLGDTEGTRCTAYCGPNCLWGEGRVGKGDLKNEKEKRIGGGLGEKYGKKSVEGKW